MKIIREVQCDGAGCWNKRFNLPLRVAAHGGEGVCAHFCGSGLPAEQVVLGEVHVVHKRRDLQRHVLLFSETSASVFEQIAIRCISPQKTNERTGGWRRLGGDCHAAAAGRMSLVASPLAAALAGAGLPCFALEAPQAAGGAQVEEVHASSTAASSPLREGCEQC